MPSRTPSSSARTDDMTPEEQLAAKMGELDLKNKESQTQMAAARLGLSYISLVGLPISPGPLSVISEEDARKYDVVCFEQKAGEVWLGVVSPEKKAVQAFLKKLAEELHVTTVLYVISQASFDAAVKLYAALPKITPAVEGVAIKEEDLARYAKGYDDIRTLQDQIKAVSITEVLTLVIAVALNTNASDIHIEAEQHEVQLRLRIDGVLHVIAALPAEDWGRIISRLKLISGVKINVADRPQDGRFTIFLKEDEIDVRVSMIPTTYGESVVMRLLRSSSAGLSFAQLGLHSHVSEVLEKEVGKPNGMIITTGPTGSGKTTTLYAILNKLNSPEVKIITLEDPVEYKLEGVNQSQVDPSGNYTFAAGLRSILRQDPDVVMVGEIRDLETAEIAINAALTGHLVISTIHTNSAAGAIPRFLAMGTKPFLLAPALNAMIGQRLVRRLCTACKQEAVLDDEMRVRVQEYLSPIASRFPDTVRLETLTFFTAKGCDACHGIGYKGRVGIYEIMRMTPEIEQAISGGQVAESALQEVAVNNGMITMVQDGLLWALEGVTSVEEVFDAAQ